MLFDQIREFLNSQDLTNFIQSNPHPLAVSPSCRFVDGSFSDDPASFTLKGRRKERQRWICISGNHQFLNLSLLIIFRNSAIVLPMIAASTNFQGFVVARRRRGDHETLSCPS
jgi:hypothetical protein